MCKCVFSSNNTTTNYYYHYYYYSEYLALFIQTTQGMFAVLAIKGWVWVHVQSLSCLTLCDPVDCIPPGSSFQRISQATILEWVAISSSRGSSQPRDQTQVSCLSGRFFTTEAPGKLPSLGKNWVLEILAVTFFFFPLCGGYMLFMAVDISADGITWWGPPRCTKGPAGRLQEQPWQQSPLGQQVPSPPVMSASSAFVGNMALKLPRPSASEDFNQQKENQITFYILFNILEHGEMRSL